MAGVHFKTTGMGCRNPGSGGHRGRGNDRFEQTYGFTGENARPQANAMAAVIEPLMSGGGAPWLLYGIGGLTAILLTVQNTGLAFH